MSRDDGALPGNSTETIKISEPISVAGFVNAVNSLLSPVEADTLLSEPLSLSDLQKERTELDSRLMDELFNVTNPVTTLYPSDLVPLAPIDIDQVPSDVKLETVRCTRYDIDKKLGSNGMSYIRVRRKGIKHSPYNDDYMSNSIATIRFASKIKEKKERAKAEGHIYHPIPRDPHDVILKAQVMKPQTAYQNISDHNRNYMRYHYTSVQFIINLLSSNTLAEFKDSIVCALDYCVPGDWSENPSGSASAKCAKDLFPSSMLFIENVFYVDDRVSPKQFLDYSQEIRKWLKDQSKPSNLPVRYMTQTKLVDLNVRLGYPYLYIHQGHCQHVFLFSDLKCATAEDCIYREVYPLHMKKMYFKLPICNTCQNRELKWMVKNSSLVPNDPCHLCDICFKMLHYNPDGSKVCDFQAFVYKELSMVFGENQG